MFSTRLAALTVAGTLALAACSSAEGGTDSSSGPIKIGVVVPLTGPFAPLGIGDKAAIEQEVETINDAGGVLGRDLEVTIKDDKTDVPQSVTEYNQLAADRSYSAILSSSNVSASTAIGPSAESNKIPTIALGPVSDFKDGTNKYAFTCVAIPELYAEAMVDYLKAEGVGPSPSDTPAKDPYGQIGNDATVEAAEAAGIDVVVDEPIDLAATDFTPVITKVKAAKPDAFLVWAAGPAAVIITKQFAGSGIPLLMTGAQASNLYVEPAGAEAEGVVMTSSIAVPGRELPSGALKDAVDAFANPWLAQNDVYPPQFAFDGATGGAADRRRDREGRLGGPGEGARRAGVTRPAHAHRAVPVLLDRPRRHRQGRDRHRRRSQDGELKATPYSLEQLKTDLPH